MSVLDLALPGDVFWRCPECNAPRPAPPDSAPTCPHTWGHEPGIKMLLDPQLGEQLSFDYLDGPLLAEWVDERIGYHRLPDCERRRIRRWRKGKYARVVDVDVFLTRFDVALGEIPDHYFRRHPRLERSHA